MKTMHLAVALGAMLVTFGAAVGLGQDKIPYLQREVPTDPKDATFTGCVTRGSAAGTFILKNITKDGETTNKQTLERISVVLSGTEVDISKHVGHRVSVTGLYASEGLAFAPGATTSKPVAAEVASQVETKTSGTFRVRSLVMIADSCSQPAD